MTKIFLKTLSSFYYERMIASAPSDFTEMVNMGMRLEKVSGKDGCLKMRALLNGMGRLRRKMGRHLLCNPMLNQEDPLSRGSLCVMPTASTRWLI